MQQTSTSVSPSGIELGVTDAELGVASTSEPWSASAQWAVAAWSASLGSVLGYGVTALTRFGGWVAPHEVIALPHAQILLLAGTIGGLLVGGFASRLVFVVRDNIAAERAPRSPALCVPQRRGQMDSPKTERPATRAGRRRRLCSRGPGRSLVGAEAPAAGANSRSPEP